jgi:CheY-like chemotaxis protein
MSKKILFIENDAAFAADVARALEQTGFDVRVTGDGKEGLELAREWGPTAIVLGVELPGMSGYLVCQKLRKDDALKGIPLVLTSAEATADTFEKHRALKVRADAYHLKPYAPEALVDSLGALVGLPDAAGEEELVSLEEEIGLEVLPTDEADGALPDLDLGALPDEPAATAAPDETLSLLDDAFDGLTAPEPRRAAPPALELDLDGDRPLGDDVFETAALPLDDAPVASPGADVALDAETEAALGALGDEPAGMGADAELDLERALGEIRPPEADPDFSAELADPGAELDRELEAVRPPLRGASADLLRAAGIRLLDDAPPAPAAAVTLMPRAPDAAPALAVERLERELRDAQQALADGRSGASGRDAELRQARAHADDASRRAEDAIRRGDDAARRAEAAESALSDKDVELAALRAKADASVAQARRLEAELKTAREEARRAADGARSVEAELEALRERLTEADRRAADAEARAEEAAARADDAAEDARRKGEELAALEATTARADALERELDELRTELVVARGEADGARGEIEKRTAEVRKRIAELEAANAKHEERVLKAYQKIKNDEKMKDKVRKALAIAAQLLEEGLPAETPAEKDRRAAAVSAVAALTRE